MEKQEKEGHSQFEEFETGEETQNSYEKYIRIKDGVRIYKISRPTFTNLARDTALQGARIPEGKAPREEGRSRKKGSNP